MLEMSPHPVHTAAVKENSLMVILKNRALHTSGGGLFFVKKAVNCDRVNVNSDLSKE